VILPLTGLTAGSRNPPPSVILPVMGRRKPPPKRMRPPSVVEVLMKDSNLDSTSRYIQLREGWRMPENNAPVCGIQGTDGWTDQSLSSGADPLRHALTNAPNGARQDIFPEIGEIS
jgi:hypothetical protein